MLRKATSLILAVILSLSMFAGVFAADTSAANGDLSEQELQVISSSLRSTAAGG